MPDAGSRATGDGRPDLDRVAWDRAVGEIIRAGQRMDRHGWVPGTAGNLSHRLPGGEVALTRSGGHKGFLDPGSVIAVDPDGHVVRGAGRPSAEALLHLQIYAELPQANAVLHGHSVPATVLSMATETAALEFAGFELLKVFEGQQSHATTLTLPILDNDQDIARLCTRVGPLLPGMTMGYLIRGHGVYVWGPCMETALARLEGLEFLLACALEQRRLRA
ncbi:methylthioribulose 1-phosphate dehydratase [Lichenicoccus sp.]|uniref:methylthioribulose 1-phosphate dehydratase n=1 Tax=Lichenicoccus sp. TaxID=2781899 RepID=UPI003D13928C